MVNILYLHAGAEMYGADKVLLELIRGLDKREYTLYVILPCDGVLVDALQTAGAQVKVVPYPILRRKYFNLKGLLGYAKDYVKYSKQIFKMVEKKQIDMLHINTTAVLEGIYLKKKLKIPMIWHIHEIVTHPRSVYQFTSWMVGKYADIAVVVSNAVGQHLIQSKRIKQKKIKTIYNGVDNQVYFPQVDTNDIRKELGIPDNAFIIGMIGRINAWKGQGDFLKAVEPILQKHPDAYAVMVGGVFEGEEWRMKELLLRVGQSGNQARIRVQDFRTDPANVHNLFDVFVLPSTNPDPLPTVVLEAMASGKPIVGYRHGGICEMVQDGVNGFLTDINKPEGLGFAIEQLVSNTPLAKKMGGASLARQRERFSLEAYICNFDHLYSEFKK